MPPKTDGILESSLYVSDVSRSVRFYEEVFGFQVVTQFDRGCAMHAGERQVLLLFKKGGSRTTQSPHDGEGELHIAFAIPSVELANEQEKWGWTRVDVRNDRLRPRDREVLRHRELSCAFEHDTINIEHCFHRRRGRCEVQRARLERRFQIEESKIGRAHV